MNNLEFLLFLFAAFLSAIVLGIAIGFAMGQRYNRRQVQRADDQERAARLEQVRERAFARLDKATPAIHCHRDYGVLEAKELS